MYKFSLPWFIKIYHREGITMQQQIMEKSSIFESSLRPPNVNKQGRSFNERFYLGSIFNGPARFIDGVCSYRGRVSPSSLYFLIITFS